VIQLRHRQPSLWHSGLAKDIEDLWEPWMKEVDQLLEDAVLVESVYDAQGKRHRKSRTHGRTQTPAEVALRLLILKHVRNWVTTRWSEKYERTWSIARSPALETRRTGCQDGWHDWTSHRARSDRGAARTVDGVGARASVVRGQKMRVDTTVVETNIHYPTDSALLGDGARRADANHEEGREGCGWTEKADS